MENHKPDSIINKQLQLREPDVGIETFNFYTFFQTNFEVNKNLKGKA